MFDLSALTSVKLKEVEKKATRVTGTSGIPTIGDIKVFKSGKIFYSQEFKEKVGENGLDFINSKKWKLYPENVQQLVFVCITDLSNLKTSAKVDIRSTEVPSPAAVKNALIPMLEEIYGLDEKFNSIELKVNFDFPLAPNATGIYNIPKVVSSGSAKGEDTYTRRENVTFWPLTPVEGTSSNEAHEDEDMENAILEAQEEVETDGQLSFDLDESNNG